MTSLDDTAQGVDAGPSPGMTTICRSTSLLPTLGIAGIGNLRSLRRLFHALSTPSRNPYTFAHEVGVVGAKRRVRASNTALTRVPRLKAGVRDLSHFVGEVYDGGALSWLRPSGGAASLCLCGASFYCASPQPQHAHHHPQPGKRRRHPQRRPSSQTSPDPPRHASARTPVPPTHCRSSARTAATSTASRSPHPHGLAARWRSSADCWATERTRTRPAHRQPPRHIELRTGVGMTITSTNPSVITVRPKPRQAAPPDSDPPTVRRSAPSPPAPPAMA